MGVGVDESLHVLNLGAGGTLGGGDLGVNNLDEAILGHSSLVSTTGPGVHLGQDGLSDCVGNLTVLRGTGNFLAIVVLGAVVDAGREDISSEEEESEEDDLHVEHFDGVVVEVVGGGEVSSL